MKRIVIAIAAALAAAMFAAPALAQKTSPHTQQLGDPTIAFEVDDPRMNAAIEEARRTYPQFLAAFRNAPAHLQANYSVKVGLETTDGSREHIWVDNLYFRDGRLFGQLANHPVAIRGMYLGAPVEILPEEVSDWSIHTTGGAYGSFTTRVMVDRMSPREAAPIRESLSPQPIPPEWIS